MMTISTGGIGPVDMTTTSNQKSKVKDDKKATDAFSSLMNMTAVNQNPKTDDFDYSEGQDIKNTDYKDKTETKGYDNFKDDNEMSHNDYKKSTLKSKGSEEYDTSHGNEEIVSDAEIFIQNIKEIFIDALDVTEGELENMLNEMGISEGDLLDVNTMKQFILQTQNATEVDILINEGLADLINGVSDEINTLIEQLEVMDVSEFRDMLEGAIKQLATSDEAAMTDEKVSDFVANETVETVDTEQFNTDAQRNTNNTEVVDAEADKNISISTNQNTNSSNSSNKDHNTNYNNIAENLNNAIDNVMSDEIISDVSFDDGIDQADIIRQIIDDIKVSNSRSITSMEVQLNPESLGKVYISVVSKNGIMQAQIVAETEAARHAIENGMATLKETFNNHELKVESVDVTVASYEFFNQDTNDSFQENRQNNSSRKLSTIGQNGVLSDDELSVDEQHETELMRAKGSSVSYSV